MKIKLVAAAMALVSIVGVTQAANAGLLVEQHETTVGIGSLAAADALIGSTTPIGAVSSVINFGDTGAGLGNFGSDTAFLNDDAGGSSSQLNNTFATHVTGFVTISTGGTYTFGLNHDDGVRLRINGVDVIVSGAPTPPANHFGTIALTAGTHAIDLVHYEDFGVASLELFAALGTFTSFNPSMKLLGDTDNGGLGTTTTAAVPEPGTLALFGLGLAGLGFARRKKAA